MSKQLEAVYENGVLRPLQPLALRDQQHVMATVSEIPDYQAWAKAQPRELGPAPGLEAIQRQLASIPQLHVGLCHRRTGRAVSWRIISSTLALS